MTAIDTAPSPAVAPRSSIQAPFEALDQDHQKIVAVLADMAQLLEHLTDHGVDAHAQQTAKKIFVFFNESARQHHADEELHVFPALIREGDDTLVQHILRLQQDHGWIEEDWLELAPQFESIAAGYHWHNPEQLALAVPVFTALYHDHIALEESLIYPQAKARLTQRDLAGMGREMAQRRRQASP